MAVLAKKGKCDRKTNWKNREFLELFDDGPLAEHHVCSGLLSRSLGMDIQLLPAAGDTYPSLGRPQYPSLGRCELSLTNTALGELYPGFGSAQRPRDLWRALQSLAVICVVTSTVYAMDRKGGNRRGKAPDVLPSWIFPPFLLFYTRRESQMGMKNK